MEGLAFRVQLPCSTTASKVVSLAAASSPYLSATVRPLKTGVLPASTFGGLRSNVRQRNSPVSKVHASKKTFKSFDDMISNSDLPVLVDFYATWCGPCQLMAPILNEVGAALKDQILVVKVDTEKYPQVASRYGIQALPTFVLFRNGKPIDYLEGAQQRDQLIAHITQTLKNQKANIRT
ncbi:unnamed protein product [Calypogeia fissa]